MQITFSLKRSKWNDPPPIQRRAATALRNLKKVYDEHKGETAFGWHDQYVFLTKLKEYIKQNDHYPELQSITLTETEFQTLNYWEQQYYA